MPDRRSATGHERPAWPLAVLAGLILASSVSAQPDVAPTQSHPALYFVTSPVTPLAWLSAAGDALFHSRLQSQAYAQPVTVGFASLWSEVTPLIRRSDVAYVNVEGPAAEGVDANGEQGGDPGRAFDRVVHDSFPLINYHPSVMTNLAASGFDVISTANNHALDRGPLGVELTLAAAADAGLRTAGTRADESMPCHALTTVRGVTIAWVGCTMHTNGIADEYRLVQRCQPTEESLVELVAGLSHSPGIDAVLVMPHWGQQFVHQPEARQRTFARAVLDAGALAVIGTHPHVLQPWEKYRTRDGRDTFVMYSLGNFVSGQYPLTQRVTVLLNLALYREARGRVAIAGVSYVPLLMKNARAPYRVIPIGPESADPEADSATALIRRLLPFGNALAPESALSVPMPCAIRLPAAGSAPAENRPAMR